MCQLLDVQAACRRIDYFLVYATLRIESIRITALFHATFLQCVDDVGIDDLRDAVRDYHNGSVFLDGIDACLDLFGCYSVERSCRFVEEDDRRVLRNILAIAIRCCCPPERAVAFVSKPLGSFVICS